MKISPLFASNPLMHVSIYLLGGPYMYLSLHSPFNILDQPCVYENEY
jgi:hypothetical protein